MKTIIELALEHGVVSCGHTDPEEIKAIEDFAAEIKAARDAELFAGVEMPEPVGYVSEHTSTGPWHWQFNRTSSEVYKDTAKTIDAVVTIDQLRETVAAAVLREREACAKVCEETHDLFVTSKPSRANAGDCAAAIRNRSNA